MPRILIAPSLNLAIVTTGRTQEQSICEALENQEPLPEGLAVASFDAITANGEHNLRELGGAIQRAQQSSAATNRTVQPELGEQGAMGGVPNAAEQYALALDIREYVLGSVMPKDTNVVDYIESIRLDR